MQLIDLYSAAEVHDHILPIAFLLVDDRVYQVRVTALRVVKLYFNDTCVSKVSQSPILDYKRWAWS